MMSPYLKVGSHHVSWSPSDKMIAFSKRENGFSEIWEVPAGGGGARKLTQNDNGKDIYCCPEWSRSGDKIVFSSQARAGSFTDRGANGIWVLKKDSKQQNLVFHTNDRLLLLGLDGSGNAAVFLTAPADTGLPAVPGKTKVRAVDINNGKVTDLGELANTYFFNVQISRDGRSVAYVIRDGDTSVVKLRTLESGVEKILLAEKDPKVLISSLEWSPDGKKIVFGRQSRSNLLSMFVE